jgi:ATP-dependent 26S proteasome regulatory subunit
MADHHHEHQHPVYPGTVLGPDHLRSQFGTGGAAGGPAADAGAREIVGDDYLALVAEQAKIIEHQWSRGVRRGVVRGFLLSGPPGVGKTTLAKRLAYELGQRFPRTAGRDGVATVVIDGSDLARAKYGETETRIREVFHAAQTGFGTPRQRSILIFDDIESILMARGSEHAREWHFSQDSVFFHAVDELDTSQATLVLTTNRPDLVDEAIRDRFLEYPVGYPSPEVLATVALHRVQDQGLAADQLTSLSQDIEKAVSDGSVRSLRDAEHFAIRYYVAQVLGTRSRADRS